jgi:hypothetical protein
MIMTKLEPVPYLLVGLYLMLRASQAGCDGVFLKHTALKGILERERVQVSENAPIRVFLERIKHIFPGTDGKSSPCGLADDSILIIVPCTMDYTKCKRR